MFDDELPTPYRKAAVKARPPKGCSGNTGKAHFYVHDMMVCHSGNSISTSVLRERKMQPFCLLCGRRKRVANSELNRIVHVRKWTAEELAKSPTSRRWTYKVLGVV